MDLEASKHFPSRSHSGEDHCSHTKGYKKMSDVSLTAATYDVLIVGAGPVGLALAGDPRGPGLPRPLIDKAAPAGQQTKTPGNPGENPGMPGETGGGRAAH